MDLIPTQTIKISGYLEMKSPMRLITSWKKYWFVLEGRLLLYYRSKDEYEHAIGHCKGSINLGPPCNIKPCTSASLNCVFRIEKKTKTVTLRAENKTEQEKWMQGILSALKQNMATPNRLSHFRYSCDETTCRDISDSDSTNTTRDSFQRQYTMPGRYQLTQDGNKDLIARLQKMGAQTYCHSLTKLNGVPSKTSNLPKTPNLSRILQHYSSNNIYSTVDLENSADEDIRDNNYQTPDLRSPETENPSDLRDKNQKHPAENIYERISQDSTASEELPRYLVKENQFYAMVDKKQKRNVRENKAESGNQETRREVKSMVVENDQYACIDEIIRSPANHFSSTPKLDSTQDPQYTIPNFDCNKNSILVENDQYVTTNSCKNNEALYEDPEQIKNETKTRRNKRRLKFFTSMLKRTSRSRDSGLRKRESFVRKFLKVKRKPEEEEEGEREPEKEVVRKEEKDKIEDETSLQMLNELKKMIVGKKNKNEDETCPLDRVNTAEDIPVDNLHHEGNEIFLGGVSTDSNAPIPMHHSPSLPPKHPSYPSNPDNENQKSLDEILDELDEEKKKRDSAPNVKKMIEKFNENKTEDGVVLRRRNSAGDKSGEPVVSTDLNVLLEELAKITSAPVMAPGVTSSLVAPDLTDEEWLKLLPVRARRLSDPDYDVPRPHRSLVIPPRPKVEENAIPATRFFGPVLQNTELDTSKSLDEDLSLTNLSMTPDSLEVQTHRPPVFPADFPKTDTRNCESCFSHACSNSAQSQDDSVYDTIASTTPRKVHVTYDVEQEQQKLTKIEAESVVEKKIRSNWRYIEEDEEEESEEIVQDGECVFLDSLENITEVSTVF